jgi:DNA-binding NarL/FixJ family response regulator
MKIQLLVVEDEALVAAMIREALNGSGYAVRAVAFDVESALKYLEDEQFDAALLDINLAGKFEGIEIGRLIRDKYHFPFLYLTAHADDRTLQNAKLTEPAGYIVKPFTERELLAGLEIALYNFRQQQQKGVQLPNFESLNHKLPEPLSVREVEVLKMLFAGKSNIDIGEELFISVNTVKSHLSRLYAKLGATSRTEVMARVRDLL